MPKLMKAAALVVAVLALALALNGCKRATTGPSAKSMAPPAYASFLKGEKLSGQVALIQFGQVGCEMSAEGFQQMVKMNSAKTVPGLSFLRVDGTPNKGDAEAYFKTNPAGFGVVRDEGEEIARMFDVKAVPTVVLVDKFGRVRYRGGKLPADSQLSGWVAMLNKESADRGGDVALFNAETLDTQALVNETQLPELYGPAKPLSGYMGEKGLVVVFADVRCPYAGQALGDLPKVVPVLAKLGITTVVVNIGDPKDAVIQKYEVDMVESAATIGGAPPADSKPHKASMTGTPVLYDEKNGAKLKWKIDMVPTVFLLAKDGTMTYRAGAVWKGLASAVEQSQDLPAGSVNFEPVGTGHG